MFSIQAEDREETSAGNGLSKEIKLTENPQESHGSLFDGTLQRLVLECGLLHNNHENPEDVFDQALASSSDAVIELLPSGEIINANKSVSNTLGYESEELIGTNFFDLIFPEYRSVFQTRIKVGMESIIYQKLITENLILFRGKTKLNRVFSFESFFFPIYREGTMVFLSIVRRINQDGNLIDRLQESANNYDALSETISEAIVRINENFKIIFANSAVKQVFGYEREELLGQSFSILFPESIFERYKEEFTKYFFIDQEHRNVSGLKKNIETLGKSKNRGVSPIEISFGNSRNFKGRSVTCIIRDISQRKTIERKLKHLAFHDKLTELGNRDLFNLDLASVLNSLSKGAISALFFLDLDGFKQVNDTFGHDFGDELLIHTAKRIRRSLRQTDSIYRFGGDEFVILINGLKERSEASVIAQSVLSEIKRPFYLESMGTGTVVSIGVSIGIVLIPDDGTTATELVKNADLAMYQAKKDGKGRYIFFHSHLNSSAKERWDIEQGLKNAITKEELKLHYQPIVTSEGKVTGFEALARWFHPEIGAIPPAKFIPIAEESGLISILGNWVMERACRDLQIFNTELCSNLYVSFNLSAKQFEQKDLHGSIEKVIKRTGINPSNLRLEITETSIVKTPDNVVRVITALKEKFANIKFVLDDFGTGYSSLSYLSRMPIDSLKIDISFVRMLSDPVNYKVVTAIMNLARSLNLDIVAEGIETEKQRDFFKERDCNYLQGYLFSKPFPREDILDMLKSGAFRC